MVRLGVNIDHVATLRQVRREVYPDPVAAAVLAELGGADQITCHLREDRRHLQDRDLALLRQTVKVPLNLEMAASESMVRLALERRPDCATLVPERREELTTEGGLDALHQQAALQPQVAMLRQAGIVVSLFIDPDLEQVKTAHRLAADAVEFHTGRFCDQFGKSEAGAELQRLQEAVKMAQRLKLEVRAGHGLDSRNILPLLAIPEIVEYNIGHFLVAQAVLVGMERAVREMKNLLNRGWS